MVVFRGSRRRQEGGRPHHGAANGLAHAIPPGYRQAKETKRGGKDGRDSEDRDRKRIHEFLVELRLAAGRQFGPVPLGSLSNRLLVISPMQRPWTPTAQSYR